MPLHNANHSDIQLYKAANTTVIFYHVVTAHQSSPEMMAGLRKAYMAILTKLQRQQELCAVMWKHHGRQEFRKN